MSADDPGMVVIDGVRYRREDAERLGLLTKESAKPKPEAKAAEPPKNKARSANTKGKD